MMRDGYDWDLRSLYMSGYAVGQCAGIRDGYVRGYGDGHRDGERHARLTDAEFLDALAARVRADDELREAVQRVIRSTTAAIDAEKHRRERDEGRRAA